MKFTHPGSARDIIAVSGTQLLGEVEHAPLPGWITIGYVGGSGLLLIDTDEWAAFKTLVAEIDEALK